MRLKPRHCAQLLDQVCLRSELPLLQASCLSENMENTHLLTNTLLWVARQGEFAFTAKPGGDSQLSSRKAMEGALISQCYSRSAPPRFCHCK